MTFLNLLEYIGTIAFAISGAMVGIENRMDIFGVVMLGLTTAVGGGILRDALLGINPPSIFNNPITLILAFVFALACFMSKPRACFKKAELSIEDIGKTERTKKNAIILYDRSRKKLITIDSLSENYDRFARSLRLNEKTK